MPQNRKKASERKIKEKKTDMLTDFKYIEPFNFRCWSPLKGHDESKIF